VTVDNIYKFAAQNRLRFPSIKGGDGLTVEQLFDLPLESKTGFDLNSVAKTINAQLKGAAEESFVADTSADPKKVFLTAALDIVKDVIATKQAANRAAADKAKQAAEMQVLLGAIDAKKTEAIAAMPLEELEKRLAALRAGK